MQKRTKTPPHNLKKKWHLMVPLLRRVLPNGVRKNSLVLPNIVLKKVKEMKEEQTRLKHQQLCFAKLSPLLKFLLNSWKEFNQCFLFYRLSPNLKVFRVFHWLLSAVIMKCVNSIFELRQTISGGFKTLPNRRCEKITPPKINSGAPNKGERTDNQQKAELLKASLNYEKRDCSSPPTYGWQNSSRKLCCCCCCFCQPSGGSQGQNSAADSERGSTTEHQLREGKK